MQALGSARLMPAVYLFCSALTFDTTIRIGHFSAFGGCKTVRRGFETCDVLAFQFYAMTFFDQAEMRFTSSIGTNETDSEA